MNELFGSEYADAYDVLYQDKDYLEESQLIDRLFQTYGNGPVRTVLDVGCGTGNHGLWLAQRGYDVVGVDRSAGMVESARMKAVSRQIDGTANFYQADIHSFQAEQSFDASLMMFAVVGDQLE